MLHGVCICVNGKRTPESIDLPENNLTACKGIQHAFRAPAADQLHLSLLQQLYAPGKRNGFQICITPEQNRIIQLTGSSTWQRAACPFCILCRKFLKLLIQHLPDSSALACIQQTSLLTYAQQGQGIVAWIQRPRIHRAYTPRFKHPGTSFRRQPGHVSPGRSTPVHGSGATPGCRRTGAQTS